MECRESICSTPPCNGVCKKAGCSSGRRLNHDLGAWWECKGIGGGTDSGPCPVKGICGELVGCKKGSPRRGTGVDSDKWKCRGLHGGGDSDWCSVDPDCAEHDCSEECCDRNDCCP